MLTKSFLQEEITEALLDEIIPLLVGHYAELPRFKDIKPEPDWDFYLKAGSIGVMKCFTLREEGKLIGYAVFSVSKHPHFKNSLQAVHDLLYLEPASRKGRNGIEFIKDCDEALTAMGCQVISWSSNSQHDYSAILERLGYQLVDLTFSRKTDRR